MKKFVAILVLLSLLLSSCGSETEKEEVEATENKEVVKKDFFIETKKLSDFGSWGEIKKTGKIKGTEDIEVSSQAYGKVSYISYKEGDIVSSGSVVVGLSDNIKNYGLTLEKTKNSLEGAKLSYDSNLISIDKNIKDLEIQLNKLISDKNILEEDIKERVSKSKADLESATLDSTTSKSSLDIEKMENDYDKAKFDYETSLTQDNQTIEQYKRNIGVQKSSLQIVYDSLEGIDEVLGVTEKNKNLNSAYDNYLGAKNLEQKEDTKDLLEDVIAYKTTVSSISTSMEESDMVKYLEIMEKGYTDILALYDGYKLVLDNSVEAGSLTSTVLSTYKTTLSTQKSSAISNYNSLITLKNQVVSFLETYKSLQESKVKNLDIMLKNIEITKKSLELGQTTAESGYNRILLDAKNNLVAIETTIKTTENSLETAMKNKEVTLKQLQNSIDAANIAYREASKEYGKLTIEAPITGRISEIYIDKGEEVAPGTPIFKIVNSKNQELTISLSKDELEYVELWKPVKIEYNGNILAGKVSSISTVADDNLNYKTTLQVDETVNIVGGFANVIISVDTGKTLIPLNILSVKGNSEGYLNIYKDGKLEERLVNIGSIWGDNVELLSEDIDSSMDIVVSDIGNYDDRLFNIILKEDNEAVEEEVFEDMGN